MPPRTRVCEPSVRRERLRRAEELWRVGREAMELSEEQTDVADAVATMFIHSGFASSDVICCARPGLFSQGEDHRQAIDLLNQADAGASPHLAALSSLKTKAAYSHVRVSTSELTRALRAADHLLTTARRIGA